MHSKTYAALGNTIKLHYRWWILMCGANGTLFPLKSTAETLMRLWASTSADTLIESVEDETGRSDLHCFQSAVDWVRQDWVAHFLLGKQNDSLSFDAVVIHPQPEAGGWPTCGTGHGNVHGVLVKCQLGGLKSTKIEHSLFFFIIGKCFGTHE